MTRTELETMVAEENKGETNMTRTELETMVAEGKIREHHTSYFRGYVSRKSDGYVKPYHGHFGEGYALLSPNWNSTTYSYITYYIFN